MTVVRARPWSLSRRSWWETDQTSHAARTTRRTEDATRSCSKVQAPCHRRSRNRPWRHEHQLNGVDGNPPGTAANREGEVVERLVLFGIDSQPLKQPGIGHRYRRPRVNDGKQTLRRVDWCHGNDRSPNDGTIRKVWLAKIDVSVCPTLGHAMSAQADEQRFIQRWNALNGCSDDSHGVERIEKFIEFFGVGNDTPSGVNSDPPTPIALHDQLFHCPYRSQGVRQEPLTRREPHVSPSRESASVAATPASAPSRAWA